MSEALIQSISDCIHFVFTFPFRDEDKYKKDKSSEAEEPSWQIYESSYVDRGYDMQGYFRQRQYGYGNTNKLPRPHLDRAHNPRKMANHPQAAVQYYKVEESVRDIATFTSQQQQSQNIITSANTAPTKTVNIPAALHPIGGQSFIPARGLKGSRPIVKLDRLSLLTRSTNADDSDTSGPNSAVSTQPYKATARQSRDISEVTETALRPSPGQSSGRKRHVSASEVPSLAFKDLVLTHVIGGGGFGQVWHAEWKGTPVAVKVLSNICQTALPEQVVTAFEEEVAMLAQLRHPNICLFLGVCLEPPHRTIVTELVSRGSLWDVLRIPGIFQHQQLTMSGAGRTPAALRVGADFVQWPGWAMRKVLEGTCRGLVYLHGCDPPVIHRDLKSANLLLDESFNVKICDFGLARLRDYTTVLTANVGTIQWMAPEVLVGNAYNESADIYSLAIVMWELLTGRCPYEGEAQMEVAIAVTHRAHRPALPEVCSTEQWNIINQCWATDPVARPTALQLLKELESAFPA